jgi:hypothetical protein
MIDLYNENLAANFITGVAFLFDKNMGNCSASALTAGSDSISLGSGLGMGLRLRSPEEFFHLDDTYFYVGKVTNYYMICLFHDNVLLNNLENKSELSEVFYVTCSRQCEPTTSHRFRQIVRRTGLLKSTFYQ